MHDIVYILKEKIETDEFRYSLRSVEKNFPFRYVWTFGGCPDDISPDKKALIDQVGKTKWEKVSYTLREVCKNDAVTDDFWLFNDDFFIMDKVQTLKPMLRGTLRDRCNGIQKKYGYLTKYGHQLLRTEKELQEHGFDTLDYTLHVPMLINKKKCTECLDTFPNSPMFRSLYGNFAHIGGIITDDVKMVALDQEPTGEEQLLSTSDASFQNGEVGRYIRSMFPNKSRYETCR